MSVIPVLSWRAFWYFIHSSILRNYKFQLHHKGAATWQNQQSDCAPSEDSDQPGHPPSLIIRVFAVCMKKAWVLSYTWSPQRRLWSDWADAQADLSLHWAHTHFVGFVMLRLKLSGWCSFIILLHFRSQMLYSTQTKNLSKDRVMLSCSCNLSSSFPFQADTFLLDLISFFLLFRRKAFPVWLCHYLVTHFWLPSNKWDWGKQCKPRSRHLIRVYTVCLQNFIFVIK